MKTVMKKLLSVMLVALLLVSAVPFHASADENSGTTVTIFEVDLDGNAKQIDEVAGVDVASYESVDALVAALYDGQWKDYRFKDFGDGSAMLQIWPMETPEGKTVIKLKVMKNNGTSDYTLVEMYAGDYILDAIEAAGVSYSWEGHNFMGWLTNHTANGADEAQYVVNRYTTANEDMTIWADWEEITDDDDDNNDVVYDAVLKIYVNGKTSSAAKTVNLDAYSLDGKVTRSEVELAVKKYYTAADSNGMSFYGLFTTKTWNSGNYDTEDAVSSVELDANETTYIYVMVKNATAISSGSTSNSNADTSNPQTGDGIVIALAVMMTTGGAALTLGKKKF